ncbi:MAG: hypothetical protein H7338_04905 [Candidatus Sericytochromatia bacterium]|nr:hypothetical protein [Candidatus Sericytochromatia bacterium]
MTRHVFPSMLLALLVTTAEIAACTGPTGTVTGDAQGAIRDNDVRSSVLQGKAVQYYKLVAKPHKVSLATLFKDDGRRLNVTDLSADVGAVKKVMVKGSDKQEDVIESTATCKSAIGSGAAHEIGFSEQTLPVMSDLDNVSTVTDKTTGKSRTYQFDQEFQRFTVSDGGQELKIVTNPDGTYTVKGQAAATPAAAAKLIVATDLGKGTSVESLAAIYGTVLERRKYAQPTLLTSGAGAGPKGGPQDDPGDLILAVIDELIK